MMLQQFSGIIACRSLILHMRGGADHEQQIPWNVFNSLVHHLAPVKHFVVASRQQKTDHQIDGVIGKQLAVGEGFDRPRRQLHAFFQPPAENHCRTMGDLSLSLMRGDFHQLFSREQGACMVFRQFQQGQGQTGMSEIAAEIEANGFA
jgi:hypothetical protein